MSESVEQKSPEQQREEAIKIAVVHQKALDNLVRLDLRNYLNMLTASGVSGNDKHQIKLSLERAIMAGMDYGVSVTNQGLQQTGKFATIENSMAAHIARLRENSMLIIADKLEKETTNTKGENNE